MFCQQFHTINYTTGGVHKKNVSLINAIFSFTSVNLSNDIYFKAKIDAKEMYLIYELFVIFAHVSHHRLSRPEKLETSK